MLDQLVGTVSDLAKLTEQNTRSTGAFRNFCREFGLQTENRRILDQLINCNDENG